VAARDTRRLLVALAASTLPMFTVSMNNLVVTSALPSIGADLGIGVGDLHWVFSAYVLVFAAGLLASAGLGERFGRRRVFLLGVAWFGLSSVGCALAENGVQLVACRVAQGLGAAVVLPLSLTLLTSVVSDRQRDLAVGLWSGFGGFSLATGAMIGGAVTSDLSWRWIFWLNVPVAALALPLGLLAFRPSAPVRRQPDVPSAALVGIAIALGVWAITEVTRRGWLSTPVLIGFAGCALALTAYHLRQSRVENPLLPREFYRNRPLLLTNLTCLSLYFGAFGSVFFLMQYLQGPQGYTPWEAGVRTLPWTAMPLLTSPLTGLVLSRVGPGRVLMVAATLQAVGLGWIAAVATPGLDYVTVVIPLVLAGAGMGMEFSATNALALDSVRPEHRNLSVGARNSTSEIGGVLGVSVLTTVFQFGERAHPGLAPDDRFVSGLVPAIWVGVAVILTGVLAGYAIARGSPDRVPAPA
jgi:EmrB/QacA subfamily drug resistance transporter